MNPRPLGYEPYDVRLRRLGESLVTALAWADVRREVVSGLLRLPYLESSRCVRFTNRFTEPHHGLRIPVVRSVKKPVLGAALTHRLNLAAAEPDGGRVLSGVGGADHTVTRRRPGQIPTGANTRMAWSRKATHLPVVMSTVDIRSCNPGLSAWEVGPPACKSSSRAAGTRPTSC